MSSLAKEVNAHNLSQGLPDFPIAPELTRFLTEGTVAGYNQYAPMAGRQELRENIASHFNSIYQTTACTPDTITITPGATYGIFTSLAALLNKGDEVIYLEPAFDCYLPAIEINGGIPVCIQLDPQKNYKLDWQKIKDAISPKTRAILINTPHNPTGNLFTENDWRQLAALVAEKNIYIISDEVYNTIIYDGAKHLPGFLQESLSDRIISIYSFGKMYHITGWKIGFVIAGKAITEAFRSIHQYLSFSVNTPAQYALEHYLPKAPANAAEILQAKRDLLIGGLSSSNFKVPFISKGSYFQLFDYSGLSNLPDTEFARRLAIEHKVATIPLSAFYRTNPGIPQLRLSFAKDDTVLKAAVEILNKL